MLGFRGKRIGQLGLWVCVWVLGTGAHEAHAHGTVAAGDFYAGILHPIVHIEQALALLATGLWCGQTGGNRGLRAAALFTAMLGAGAVCALRGLRFDAAPIAVATSLVALGLLVALRGPLPDALALPLAGLFGAIHGFALAGGMATQLTAPLGYASGLLLSTALALFYPAWFVRRFELFEVQVGVRIAGSWVGATGLILLALRLRG